MDLQFGIFVGVDGHDEGKLQSLGFCIGFQSHRRTQSRSRSQLRSNKRAKNPTLPYYLSTAVRRTKAYVQRRTTAQQYTDSR